MKSFPPDFVQDPYPYFRKLREGGPVHYLEQDRCWYVIGYKAGSAVLKDHNIYSSRFYARFEPYLAGADPPEQSKVRELLKGYFSKDSIERLVPDIRATAQTLLTKLRERDSFDFISEFAEALPLTITAQFLGITELPIATLKRWATSFFSMETEEDRQRFAIAEREVFEYCKDYLSRSQGPGIIYSLRHGATPQPLELVASIAKFLMIAGPGTSTNLIGNAVYVLLKKPELFEALRANRRLVPQFVEEVLRCESPFQSIKRVTTRDTELCGVLIPMNSIVIVSLGAANRDPEQFSNPDEFRIERTPQNHLAFSLGPHFCLGSWFGLQKSQIAIEEILSLPRLSSLVPVAELRFKPLPFLRSLERMELTTNE